MLYKYLAVYIRIRGMYNVPVQCRRDSRPLRTDIDEAQRHFLVQHPDDAPPYARALEKLFTHFLITHGFYERMSDLFKELLRNLGTSVRGDEKVSILQEILVMLCLFLQYPLEMASGCIH